MFNVFQVFLVSQGKLGTREPISLQAVLTAAVNVSHYARARGKTASAPSATVMAFAE
jgi:hypothetical protein